MKQQFVTQQRRGTTATICAFNTTFVICYQWFN